MVDERVVDYEYRDVFVGHGPGWQSLTVPVIDFVLDNGGTVFQIKEKFGALRIYVEGFEPGSLRDEVHRRIDEAEDKSLETCEVCGAAGELRSGRWLKTLCDYHHSHKEVG